MNDETAHSGSASAQPHSADSSGYDPITETFHSRFDDGSDTIVAIVEAVASVTNCELSAMSPLYDTVDPEALTDIVTSGRDRPIDVSFSYEGCWVTVSSNGHVVVEPPEN
ncbi:hypothetical protein HYG81_09250 [Natrinema zhouii]|uniref:Halobacterial output domain-containing protein n=1 Tax=Natrinema zhouii TaxID=1710539 RepID=A0A7D6GII7_9EURY|nr:HalOD1 output domain-containing protein [Natrinema zhouii]QLK24320.1 hypothetical protein HYG81_09250 [Natrinema zhouii]